MGSQMFKQQRSGSDEESWRMNKSFKVNASSEAGSLFLGSGSAMVSGDDGQTMLCFSSNNNSKAQEPPFLGRLGGWTSSRNQEMIPLFQTQQPPLYARGNVLASPSFSRFKGPFTPSQWMELEHQALVYKHFVNNVPVPHNLLFSVLKTLPPYAYSNFSSGSSLSNQIGWGTLFLGYNRNTDPEPGRCRRTDGKKWRCSRDSVPDQKYCERHINRGRHRSRKPVEGPPGQAGSGPAPPPKVPSESTIVPGFENLNQLNEAAFGVVSSDSLLNPSQKGLIPYMSSGSGQETHDWTKLSMSIPTQQMGLSVEAIPKQNDNWAPLAWENSMGGPLGEIVAEGWVNNNINPQMRASPTRVLHNSTFISLSNSSSGSGSSSRGENNEAPEAPNFCDNFLGSSGYPLI